MECEERQRSLPPSLHPSLHPDVIPFLSHFQRRLLDAPGTWAEALATARGIGILAPLWAVAPTKEGKEGGRDGERGVGGLGSLLLDLATLGERVLSQLDKGAEEESREEGAGRYVLLRMSFAVQLRSTLLEATARILVAGVKQREGKKKGKGRIDFLGAAHRASLDWCISMAAAVVGSYWKFPRERSGTRRALTAILKALGGIQREETEEMEGRREEGPLRVFLKAVLPVGMLRVVSREDVMNETTRQEEAEVYAGLWREIIVACGLTAEEADKGQEAVGALVLRGLVEEGMLKMVERLDLRYTLMIVPAKEDAEEGREVEEEEKLIPSMLMDQEILLSLTAFWESLLAHAFHAPLLVSHIPLVAPLLVRLSLARPAVSCLYRLLGLLLRALKATQALQGWDSVSRGEQDKRGEGTDLQEDAACPRSRLPPPFTSSLLPAPDIQALHRLLSSYLLRVLRRLDTFQDELLLSALGMLLAAPLLLLPFPRLLTALHLALVIGTAHTPTAHAAMLVLEEWQEAAAEEAYRRGDEEGSDGGLVAAFDAGLPRILPLFDRYLRGGTGREAAPRMEQITFQKRILRFLGHLGGKNQGIIASMEEEMGEQEDMDGGVERGSVHVALPFEDRAVSVVELDVSVVLPRLLSLAEQKGEAQTKVLASESIHALVLYLVGRGATSPASSLPPSAVSSSTAFLLRSLFPTLIHLAVDLNGVIRALFSTLIFQLIHWYSRVQSEHPEIPALLDSLTTGLAGGGKRGNYEEDRVGKSGNGPVRRLCARGMAEFVRYAIKQSNKKMTTSPVGVASLMARLERMARHPRRSFRIGGALALRLSVRYLREETTLVRLYALRLLQGGLEGLRVGRRAAEEEKEDEEEKEEFKKLVDVCLAVIPRYLRRGMDNAELLGRVRAREEEGGGPASLWELVDWIWSHAAAREPIFRQKCHEALTTLLTLLPDPPGGEPTQPSLQSTRVASSLSLSSSTRNSRVWKEQKLRRWIWARGPTEVLHVVEGAVADDVLHYQEGEKEEGKHKPSRMAKEEQESQSRATDDFEEDWTETKQRQGLRASKLRRIQSGTPKGKDEGTRQEGGEGSKARGWKESLGEGESPEAVMRSLETLQAAVDTYTWLFSRGIFPISAFFGGNEASGPASTASFLPSRSSAPQPSTTHPRRSPPPSASLPLSPGRGARRGKGVQGEEAEVVEDKAASMGKEKRKRVDDSDLTPSPPVPSASNLLACIHTILLHVWTQGGEDEKEGGGETERGIEASDSQSVETTVALRRTSVESLVHTLNFLSLLLEGEEKIREKEEEETQEETKGKAATRAQKGKGAEAPEKGRDEETTDIGPARSLERAQLLVRAGLWSIPMQRLLAWCLFHPWKRHSSSEEGLGTAVFNRPEEDATVAQELPGAVRRFLRHWRLLDQAAAASTLPDAISSSLSPSIVHTLRGMLPSSPPSSSTPSSSTLPHPATLPLDLSSCDLEEKGWALRAIATLHALGMLEGVLSEKEEGSGERNVGGRATVSLACNLFDQLSDPSFPVHLSPRSRHVAGSLFLLAVTLGLPLSPPPPASSIPSPPSSRSLTDVLLDVRRGRRDDDLSRGALFQRHFAPEIAETLAVAQSGRDCLALLLNYATRSESWGGEVDSSHPDEGETQKDKERALGGSEGMTEVIKSRLHSLFVEVIEWLLSRPALLDKEAAVVLRLCLRAPFLLPPLPSSSNPSRFSTAAAMNHLALLHRLFRLEASLPPSLRPDLGHDPRLRSLLLHLLGSEEGEVNVKCAALELLPYVLSCGVGKREEKGGSKDGNVDGGEGAFMEAVEEGITAGRFFPVVSSWEWAPGRDGGSEGGKDSRRRDANYLLLLRALLRAVGAAANYGLAIVAVQHFQEGRGHRFYSLLRAALHQMVKKLVQFQSPLRKRTESSVLWQSAKDREGGREAKEATGEEEGKCPQSPPPVEVAVFVWETLLHGTMGCVKKLLVLDTLLLPLCQQMPVQGGLLEFLQAPPRSQGGGEGGGEGRREEGQKGRTSPGPSNLLQSIVEIIGQPLVSATQGAKEGGRRVRKDDENALLLPRICAYSLLRVIYDRLSPGTIKSSLDPLIPSNLISSSSSSSSVLNRIVAKTVPPAFRLPLTGADEREEGTEGENEQMKVEGREGLASTAAMRRRAAVAAYECVVAFALKTQSKAHVVAALCIEADQKSLQWCHGLGYLNQVGGGGVKEGRGQEGGRNGQGQGSRIGRKICVARLRFGAHILHFLLIISTFPSSFSCKIIDPGRNYTFRPWEKGTNRLLPSSSSPSSSPPPSSSFMPMIGSTLAYGGTSTLALGGYSQAGASMLSLSSLAPTLSLEEEEGEVEAKGAGGLQKEGRIKIGKKEKWRGSLTLQSQLKVLEAGGGGQGDDMEEEPQNGEEDETPEETSSQRSEDAWDLSSSPSSAPSSSSSRATFSPALRRLRDLNRETCMPSFMAVLDTLGAKSVQRQQQAQSPQLSENEQQREKPAWILALETALADGDEGGRGGGREGGGGGGGGRAGEGLHRNARLFVLQACLNEPTASILAPFVNEGLGNKVLVAVTDLLVYSPSSPSSPGPSPSACHYLLCDVADTFLSAWHQYRPAPPSSPDSFAPTALDRCTAVLCYFLAHAHDDLSSLVTRRNLYYLSSLLSLWIAPPSITPSSSP